MIDSYENLGFYYNKQKDRNLMVRQTKKKRSTVFVIYIKQFLIWMFPKTGLYVYIRVIFLSR